MYVKTFFILLWHVSHKVKWLLGQSTHSGSHTLHLQLRVKKEKCENQGAPHTPWGRVRSKTHRQPSHTRTENKTQGADGGRVRRAARGALPASRAAVSRRRSSSESSWRYALVAGQTEALFAPTYSPHAWVNRPRAGSDSGRPAPRPPPPPPPAHPDSPTRREQIPVSEQLMVVV